MPNSFIDISVDARVYPFTVPKTTILASASGASSGTSGSSSGGTGGRSGTGSGSSGSLPPSGKGTSNAVSQLNWKTLSVSIPDVSAVTGALDKITSALDKLIKLLNPILKLIELYISLFSSFSKILSSLFDLLTDTLNSFVQDLGQAGVYLNILVPPALLKDSLSDISLSQLSSGGFQGFLGRLQSSLSDPNDKQRPNFSNGLVGGMIILADAESFDTFFKTLNQLAGMFDFMKLFGLNLNPPPPRGVRGRVGYFASPDGSQKYGVELDWDPPPAFARQYLITRSRTPGGEETVVDYVPTALVGKDGLIQTVKNSIALRQFTWPEKTIKVYEDPNFKPVVVSPNKPDGGGTYIDFINPPLVDYPPPESEGKPNNEARPNASTPKELYYVVQSVAAVGVTSLPQTSLTRNLVPGIGPQSQEVTIPLKFCDNSADIAVVIEHATTTTSDFEFLAPGWGRFGNWSSVQVKVLVPFVTELIGMLTKFLNQLKGMTTDASDSFSDFINQLKDKITNYIGLVQMLVRFIEELRGLLLGESVAFLYVPPATGGTSNFVNRVRSAKVPSPGFSGSSGITAGIVLMFGAPAVGASAADTAKFAALQTAFTSITKLLGGK